MNFVKTFGFGLLLAMPVVLILYIPLIIAWIKSRANMEADEATAIFITYKIFGCVAIPCPTLAILMMFALSAIFFLTGLFMLSRESLIFE